MRGVSLEHRTYHLPITQIACLNRLNVFDLSHHLSAAHPVGFVISNIPFDFANERSEQQITL